MAAGLRAIMPMLGSVVVFSIGINILMFVSPLYMLQIYDRVLSGRSEGTLITITLIAAVLLAVYGLLEMVRTRVLVRAGIMFDEKIAQPTFNAVHRGVLRKPDAGLVQGLRDVDTLREFLTGAGVIAFCDAPWFPVFVFAAFLLHPWYGWIAIVGSAVVWSLTLLNEVLTKRDLNEASSANRSASQHAATTFRNVEVLQAMGMLGALRSIWTDRHLRHLGWQARASDRAGALIAGTKFFRMFLQIIILGTGGYLAIQREISPGGIIAGSILIGRALQPMEAAIGHWKGFVAARGALNRLKSLFALAGTKDGQMSLPRPEGAISVEGVVAGAPGGKEAILRGVTFAVAPGEVLCVVGPSGAGKTTLARVLVGIWPAAAGAVRLDGYDMKQWDPQELGQYIGYLPQDVELFAGTTAQNISRFHDDPELGAGDRRRRDRRLPRADPAPRRRLQHADRRRRPFPVGRPAPARGPGAGAVRQSEPGRAGRAQFQPGRRRRRRADPGDPDAEGARHDRGADHPQGEHPGHHRQDPRDGRRHRPGLRPA